MWQEALEGGGGADSILWWAATLDASILVSGWFDQTWLTSLQPDADDVVSFLRTLTVFSLFLVSGWHQRADV